jgi:UDP-N-acetylmuramoyl-L-alanyl-D-glutamate--2,6-diaminopimelate ligase
MPLLTRVLDISGLGAPRTGASVGSSGAMRDPDVTAVVYDSRAVTPGAIFVAIAGFHVDGHAFARDAVTAGAVAVIAEHAPDPAVPEETPVVIVPDTRVALSALAAAMAGYPSRDMLVAGITGTDGKTTTATLLWSAWRAAGLAAASLTTVDWRCGAEVTPNTTRQTTLEAVELQNLLATFKRRGCDHVALETSSHALALHRVDDVDYRCAVYTRVTSEHLEVHGDRAAYLDAKARLARMVARRPDGIAVLDPGDEFAFPVLSAIPVATRLTYSADPAVVADVHADDVRATSRGLAFALRSPWGDAQVQLQIAGGFNVINALAAITAACATGARLDAAVAGVEAVEHVSGRMERIEMGQPFAVVVDYAHTSESLATVLQELRRATTGRLWAVFGSAGERDVDKRAAMGAVAASHADRIVIADEDPRGEDRARILEDIAAAARAAGAVDGLTLWIIADRAEAIRHALEAAAPGDTVLLAGKGHEGSIITATGSVPWNERREAERVIAARLGVVPR